MSVLSQTGWRCCQSKANSSLDDGARSREQSLAGERLPLGQCGRSAFLEGLAIDKMAFEIEVIVDVGVDTGELL